MARKKSANRYSGKVVLVVGGGAGMGLITARNLARRGATVVVADYDAAALNVVRANHPSWHIRSLDIRDVEAVRTLIEDTERKIGPVFRATVTAAIAPGADFLEDTAEAFANVINVNVAGVSNVAHAVVPRMVERGAGEFVAYGSVAGEMLTPGLSAYCTSKAAVNAYMEVLAYELKDTGVLVHCARPPGTKTELLGQMVAGNESSMISVGLERNIFAEPDDVVAAIESDIDRGKTVSFPMISAKVIHLMRRISPGLTWWLIGQSER